MKLPFALPVITMVCGFAASAGAAEHRISSWNVGKTLFGEPFTKAATKDKVVVIENWGVNCPPCIASLPHLAKLEKDNRSKGLLIIGAESQGSTKEAIKPLIEKAKVEYTITEGASGPIQIAGIPHAFVFDRQGLLVFDGHPMDSGFEAAVKKALSTGAPPAAAPATAAVGSKASTAPLIASSTWTNSDGKEIRAAVKSADSTNVVFLMDGGKEVTYPLAKLSEESRNAITLLAK